MQVYRGMDIGTAKPSPDERSEVDYAMIDVCDPEEPFSVADFQREARVAVSGLVAAGRRVIVVGGSGLHMRALVDPMEFPPHDHDVRTAVRSLGGEAAREQLLVADPHAGQVVDLANPRRVERALEVFRLTGQTPSERSAAPDARRLAAYEPLLEFGGLGVDPAGELEARVRARFAGMMAAGLLDEVAGLAGRLGPTARQAVGYKELVPVVAGALSLDEGVEQAIRATLALAKRQRTYFRRDPRFTWIRWESDASRRYVGFRSEVDRLMSWTS